MRSCSYGWTYYPIMKVWEFLDFQDLEECVALDWRKCRIVWPPVQNIYCHSFYQKKHDLMFYYQLGTGNALFFCQWDWGWMLAAITQDNRHFQLFFWQRISELLDEELQAMGLLLSHVTDSFFSMYPAILWGNLDKITSVPEKMMGKKNPLLNPQQQHSVTHLIELHLLLTPAAPGPAKTT